MTARPVHAVHAAERPCPRCGAVFTCGMGGKLPCACTRVCLSAAQLLNLQHAYQGCLCLQCLGELEQAKALSRPQG